MKISNETKVGILTIVSITILILGYNFLKGKELFTKTRTIYAVFSDLGSLEKSNQVKISGLPVGIVYDMHPKDKEISGIVITINLTRDVNIPDNSLAYISTPLVGAPVIIIERGNSTNYLKSGDTLKTRVDSGILDDVKAQLNPTLVKMQEALDSLRYLLGKTNRIFDAEVKYNIQHTISNLNDASGSLKELLNTQTGPLAGTIRNVNSVTENLRKNNDSITQLISNSRRLTGRLADLNLQKTIDSIDATLSFLKASAARITGNDGTLGKLINDQELYRRLSDAILAAEILMDDIRVHPKRYTGSIIFNRKDRTGPLTSPTKKDSIPAGNQ
jgi:phospholipid/cholesterol/gamma-HCH transport system substrate-binding protein